MNNQRYVCLGSCKALITEEVYEGGLKFCGNDACDNKGKPFLNGSKCEKCGVTYSQDENHTC